MEVHLVGCWVVWQALVGVDVKQSTPEKNFGLCMGILEGSSAGAPQFRSLTCSKALMHMV